MKKLLLVLSISLLITTTTYSQMLKVGDMAPEINLRSINGENIALSSLRGKLVLVDFWASWCVPCRKEHPNLVEAYEKYKEVTFKNGIGFTIYSVSLDENPLAMKAAIKKDKITWENHVNDTLGWKNPARIAYGVKGIPANFLIDADGQIVAVNLRGDKLESKLRKLEKKSWFSFFDN